MYVRAASSLRFAGAGAACLINSFGCGWVVCRRGKSKNRASYGVVLQYYQQYGHQCTFSVRYRYRLDLRNDSRQMTWHTLSATYGVNNREATPLRLRGTMTIPWLHICSVKRKL